MNFFSTLAINLKPSATVEITSLAKQLIDEGQDIILLSVGEPDFDTPEVIKQKAIEGINKGYNKYTPSGGMIELRKKLANYYNKKFNLNTTFENFIISNGGKQALFNIIASLVNKNDEIIIPPIRWVSYEDIIKFFGGVPISLPGESAIYDWELLPQYITPKTKAILINTPSNPTGEIFSEKDFKQLITIASQYNLHIISDEIYYDLTYNGEKLSILNFCQELENISIINGFSKNLAMTGWRIGYSLTSKERAKIINNIQGQTTNHPSSISQYAALNFELAFPEIEKMAIEYKKRAVFIKNLLSNIDNIYFKEPAGAFYYFIDISFYYNKEINNSAKLAKYLLSNYKVAVVPGIAFGNDKYIRISFAKDIKTLEEGINRIKEGLYSLRK